MTDAEQITKLQRDCWHLISMIEFLSEATGEGLELEDASLMDQIKADLPPQVREELPGSLEAQSAKVNPMGASNECMSCGGDARGCMC